MRTVSSPKKMSAVCSVLKSKKYTVGFVPTMGALHEGHLELVRQAKKRCDKTVVSIFVNPAQFGPKEDFKKYPRNFRKDASLLKKEGVDYIFLPTKKSMYPQGYKIFVEVADLGKIMCGVSRPDHFRGVATVVAKLLNIVKPDVLFLGAKDFQQQAIIRKMVKDLNLDIKIATVPTVREKDGLAMSSRNAYLSIKERKIALSLPFIKDGKRLGQERGRDAQRIIKDQEYDNERKMLISIILIYATRSIGQDQKIRKNLIVLPPILKDPPIDNIAA